MKRIQTEKIKKYIESMLQNREITRIQRCREKMKLNEEMKNDRYN